MHLGAAAGFALALAALAQRAAQGNALDRDRFRQLETGALYGPGLDQFGLATERLLIARVARPVDALFAMEEALKCRALSAVVAELRRGTGPHRDAAALARAREGRRRSASCCATSVKRCAERGAHALAGRGRAERAG